MALLYPDLPQVLPAYRQHPTAWKTEYTTGNDVSYFAYYGISFLINKNGKTRRVKILGSEGPFNKGIENRLKLYLKKIQFRPLFADGQPMTDTISLRYYIGYENCNDVFSSPLSQYLILGCLQNLCFNKTASSLKEAGISLLPVNA